jgi:opacity protein-like surface antigen
MAVDVNRDFFDYRSYRIGPNLSYIFELMPLTVRCSYSYEKLDYTDRWARNNDGWGSPKYDDQWETTHDVVIGLQYELTEKLDLLAQWEYTKGGSNNDFETAYTYDYRVNHFILGGKYEF